MILRLNLNWLADTIALVTFAFVTGMAVEIGLSGLTLEQSLHSRLLAIPLNALIARPYGLYRDYLFRRTAADHKARYVRMLVDITAFLTFMMPQYAAVLWWVGADIFQILIACFTVLVLSMVVGRPYGLYMVFCRKVLERWRSDGRTSHYN